MCSLQFVDREGSQTLLRSSTISSDTVDAPIADLLNGRVADLARLPHPGAGETWTRWRGLIDFAAQDLALGRLVEGHVDALAILRELNRAELIEPPATWGVWAAGTGELIATPLNGGWKLTGAKAWCSGSVQLDRALVTAQGPDGALLFALAPNTEGVTREHGSWSPLGMDETCSETLHFDLAVTNSSLIGGVESYVNRPGFHHGGAGVAACWYGGAIAVVERLAQRADENVFNTVRWGRCRARLEAAGARLEMGAREIDRHPHDPIIGRRVAASVRLSVEEACRHTLTDVVEALGAGALAHDVEHHQRVANLMVYLRQLHPDRDASHYGSLGGERLRW